MHSYLMYQTINILFSLVVLARARTLSDKMDREVGYSPLFIPCQNEKNKCRHLMQRLDYHNTIACLSLGERIFKKKQGSPLKKLNFSLFVF